MPITLNEGRNLFLLRRKCFKVGNIHQRKLGRNQIEGSDQTAYINHSCEPNAFMRAAPGNRVLFFALRYLAAGEEIKIDYRDKEHPNARDCRCGAIKCRARKEEKGRRTTIAKNI